MLKLNNRFSLDLYLIIPKSSVSAIILDVNLLPQKQWR